MNREEHLQKTFPLEDGTTYIQNLDKSFRYCQAHIEMEDKCEVQCEHCKEYYRPLIELTERERYDWLIWECGKRGVEIQWGRMKLPSHKWFDIYHTYNEETKDIIVPHTIEECDEEFVKLLKRI